MNSVSCFFRDNFTYYFKLKYFLAYKLSKSMDQPLKLQFRYPKISISLKAKPSCV